MNANGLHDRLTLPGSAALMPSQISVRNRPQDWASIFGQEDITRVIAKDVARGNPRNVVFTGPTGTGKTTLSLITSGALICQSPTPEGSACQICDACTAFRTGKNVDFRKVHCPTHG